MCHGLCKLGCHFAGCCYGIPYRGMCAITFPIEKNLSNDITVFPVQLLEFFVLEILAYYIWSRRKKNKSSIFLYLSMYSACRFVLEFLRNAHTKNHVGILSDVQWISLVIVIIFIINKWRGRKKTNDESV